jgi:hypothetical protein
MPDMTQIFGRGNGSYDPLRGKPGSVPARQVRYGENYGSGPMGLPVRRVMRDGRPMGYEIQFQDEWMPMDQFNDPIFQESFFEPWRRNRIQGSAGELAGEYAGNPGAVRALSGFRGLGGGGGGGGGYARDRSVRSQTTRRGGGYDPAMIERLLSGG